MKKTVLITIIFLLILSTAIIKNSAKKTEDEIFLVKENLRVLNSEFGNILLEHNYLSSAERLLEYQSLYFENELIQKNLQNIKLYKIRNKVKIIQDLKIIKRIIKIIIHIKKMKQVSILNSIELHLFFSFFF